MAEATSAWLASIGQAHQIARRFYLTSKEQELQDTCQSGREAVENLKQKVEEYHNVLERLESLQETLDGKGGQLEQLTSEHERLQQLYDTDKRNLTRVRQDKADIEQELDRLRNDLKALNDQIGAARQSLEATVSENTALTNSMQQQQRDKAADVERWETRFQNEKDRLRGVDAKQKKLRDELENGRVDHNRRVHEVLVREKEATRIAGVNSTMRAELDLATETLRSITGLINPPDSAYPVLDEAKLIAETVVTRLSTLNHEIAGKQNTIQMHLQTINQRARDIQTFQAEKKQLQASNDDLRGSNSTLSTEIASKQNTIQMQLQTIKLKDNIINQRAEDVQTLKAEQRRLQMSSYHLRGSHTILSTEIDRLKLRVRELELSAELSSEQYNMLESSKDVLHSQNIQQSREIERLQQAREKQDDSLRSVRQERNQAETINSRITRELSTKEAELKSLAEEKDNLRSHNMELEEELSNKDGEYELLEITAATTQSRLTAAENDLASEKERMAELDRKFQELASTNNNNKGEIDRLQKVETQLQQQSSQTAQKLKEEVFTSQQKIQELHSKSEELVIAQSQLSKSEEQFHEFRNQIGDHLVGTWPRGSRRELNNESTISEVGNIVRELLSTKKSVADLSQQIFPGATCTSEEALVAIAGWAKAAISEKSEFKNEQKNSQAKLSNASKEIVILKARNSEMRAEADKVPNLKKDLSAAVQKLQDSEEVHRTEIKTKSDELAELHTQLSTIKADFAEVEVAASKVPQLERQLFDATRELKIAEESCSNLTAESKANADKAFNAENQLLASRQELNQLIEVRARRSSDLQQDLLTVQEERDSLRENLTRTTIEAEKVPVLEQQLSTLTEQHDQVIQSGATKVSGLEHQLSTVRQEFDQFKEEYKKTRLGADKVQGLEQQLFTLRQDRDQLSREYKAAKDTALRVPALEQELLTARQERDQLKEYHSRAMFEKNKTADLEQELSAAKKEQEQLIYECRRARDKARQVADLKQQLSSITRERDQLSDECEAIRLEANKVPSLEKQLSNATKQCRQIAKERDQLNADNNEAIQDRDVEIDDLRNQLAEMAQENDKIQAELAGERRQRIRHEEASDMTPKLALEDEDSEGLDLRPLKRPRNSNLVQPANHKASRRSFDPTHRGRPRTYGKSRAQSNALQPDTVQDGAEPWYDVDDVRVPGFRYGELPDAVFETIKRQMTEKDGWDSCRAEWSNGTAKGDVKCADRFAHKLGSYMEDGYACEDCMRNQLVCVAVRRGSIQIRPLRPQQRGIATKAEMAYWVLESETP